ncbi:MAG: tRNA (adenosine(37)-N6)-dimethylallyltransferase MiaA [Anaerolineales bacterium]|nr:MAG: tRNA (adenosine(37)-N6)-dimethylallyltransferase MiaA [Anaerolineales bacterium]
MPSTEEAITVVDKAGDNSAVTRPLVAVVGPTAVGKTETAIQLAEKLNGEIVSADSRLLYRGMDIGTAKPTQEDLQRVPHHLIDVAQLDEVWSLATYKTAAMQAIEEIHSNKHLPFLVGGTGQYIRAILEQWDVPQAQPNQQLRSILQAWAHKESRERLHERLAILDLEAAKQIDPRNLRRTIRALEVILTTGKRFSSLRTSAPSKYQVFMVGLIRPRPELYTRIDERIHQMIKMGVIEEVQTLLDMGYHPDLPPLSAIGYREVIAYLKGKISLDEAVEQMKRRTRVFVRRQANWFKLENPDIHWYGMKANVVDEIEAAIREWLRAR